MSLCCAVQLSADEWSGCLFTSSVLVLRVSFLINAVAVVVMLFLSSREAAVACVVLLSVVFPKTAVLSPHISRSETVAGSVIGVRATRVVV